MTDSEYFEAKVRAFTLFCWSRKLLLLLMFLIGIAPIYFLVSVAKVDKYRSKIQFAKLDYELWMPNFYSLRAAEIFLASQAKAGGGAAAAEPAGDISASEDMEPMTPDEFATMLAVTVPKARIVNSVNEVEFVVRDPEFVDEVLYPMVNIAREMFIEDSREREKRVNQLYADVSQGSLTQKQRDTIEENLLNFKLTNIVREADVRFGVRTREVFKNKVVSQSPTSRLAWSLILSMLLSGFVFLVAFVAKEIRAAHGARAR